MKVITVKGLVDMSELLVSDHVEVGENHRKIATEYRYRHDLVDEGDRPVLWGKDEPGIEGQPVRAGELARRDVNINILRGFETESVQGQIG